MPEQTGHLYAVSKSHRLGTPHFRAEPPEMRDHQRAGQNVQCVQSREREINSEISAVRRDECGKALDVRARYLDHRRVALAFVTGAWCASGFLLRLGIMLR